MSHVWLAREDGDVDVPKITTAVLAERMRRFRPIAVKDGHTYAMAVPDPRDVAFDWDPKRLHPVTFEPLLAVYTDHLCGYYGFPKPSIAEVLAQLPDDLPEGANAFCIDNDRWWGIYASGRGHRMITTFGRAGSEPCEIGPATAFDALARPARLREKPFRDPHAILDEVLK